jgi:GT2 family glycosyltransferase
MNQPHVSIIMLNWKTCERTLVCLAALSQQSYTPLSIIVVDNGSGDGSVERIVDAFPEIVVRALPTNTGFAGGVNHALRTALPAETEYVLLLNNDVDPVADFVANLVTAIEQRPEIGIATPKIVMAAQSNQLWGIGGVMLPNWMRVIGMNEPDDPRYDQQQLDFVFGCAMMIRRKLIDQVGLFDERFFVYYEDIDYCLRAGQCNYTIGYFPHIHLSHDGSHSTDQMPHWRTFLYIRSRMIFFHKHLTAAALPRFFLRESLYIASIIGRSLLRADLSTIAWYLKGLFQGIAHGHLIKRTDPLEQQSYVYH